jgi:hypothetical protein
VAIAEPIGKHEFTIELATLPKPYKLKADSQQELLAWVQALKIILAVQAETGVPPPRGGAGGY